MIKRLSIRQKLIIGTLLASLLPLAFGVAFIISDIETWLYKNNIENALSLLQQTAHHVDNSILIDTQNLTNMIASDDRLIQVDESINQYTDFNASSFEYKQSDSEQAIMRFFKSIADTHDIITFISYGTEFGGYIEYPLFKPNGPYDPRIRPWYINAFSDTESIISDPYQTLATNDLVISVDSVVRNDQTPIGVVSLTISLNNIMEDINKISYGKSGTINVISPNGIVINSPNNPEWHLQSIYELNLDPLQKAKDNHLNFYEGALDGIDKVFSIYISPLSGWQYISVIDKTEVLARSKSLSGALWTMLGLISIVIIFLMLLISSYITTPIQNLTQIIKKMASFDFSSYEKKDFLDYTRQSDEIGQISKALEGMENNFMELISNLETMNSEIKSIQIDNSQIKRIALSSTNPFKNIADSINGLLEKVSSYLYKIWEQKEHINFLADHDPLTNLPNRRSFHSRLEEVVSSGATGAVILLDMDNFKSINDSMGHIFGDKVLKLIANRLNQLKAKNVFVSRFGGDEFLVLYECQDNDMDIHQYVKTVYSIFDDIIFIDGHEIKVEFSMGISQFPADTTDLDRIIMYADLALYEMKNAGKNGYAFFNEQMATHLNYKLEVKSILLNAIEHDGFKMLYQPQVDLKSGEVVGYEALLRLKEHKLSPADFIPVAEENGLIITIGRVVTKLVIEQLGIWKTSGYTLKPVSINFSGLQLSDITYSQYLTQLLDNNHVPASTLCVEITEHIFLDNKEAAIHFLETLKALGIKTAVDDFGAEYSSLSYLANLPIDILKFDRELNVRLMDHRHKNVMEKLIAFVHSLDLKIIAEGIETQSHIDILTECGCNIVQGYYFDPPLEVDVLEKKMAITYDLLQNRL